MDGFGTVRARPQPAGGGRKANPVPRRDRAVWGTARPYLDYLDECHTDVCSGRLRPIHGMLAPERASPPDTAPGIVPPPSRGTKPQKSGCDSHPPLATSRFSPPLETQSEKKNSNCAAALPAWRTNRTHRVLLAVSCVCSPGPGGDGLGESGPGSAR